LLWKLNLLDLPSAWSVSIQLK